MANGSRTPELLERINRNAGVISAIGLALLGFFGWLGNHMWSDVRDAQQRLTTIEETLGQLDKRLSAVRNDVEATKTQLKAQQDRLGEILESQEEGFRRLNATGRSPALTPPRSAPPPASTPAQRTPPPTYSPGEPQL